MRLYQLSGYGFPGYRADSFQTARMAEAFLESGVNASIVYPWSPKTIPWRDVCPAYGLNRRPQRKVLPGIYLNPAWRFHPFSNILLRIVLVLFAIKTGSKAVFLGRHPQEDPLATLLQLKARGFLQTPIFVELHEARHYSRPADSYINGYVVISEPLKLFLTDAGVESDKILVAQNAVDFSAYQQAHRLNRRTLRSQLGLAEHQSVICYTGQLYRDRNVETLVAAMKYMEPSTILVLVGGNARRDMQRIQAHVDANQLADRVRMVGQQAAVTTMHFQLAADVLVIPYDSRLSTAAWCSPLKIWEYIASGTPIVAFPIPAFRDIFRKNEVVWVQEETPVSLADALKEAMKWQPRPFHEISARIGTWTWAERARRIAEFMEILR